MRSTSVIMSSGLRPVCAARDQIVRTRLPRAIRSRLCPPAVRGSQARLSTAAAAHREAGRFAFASCGKAARKRQDTSILLALRLARAKGTRRRGSPGVAFGLFRSVRSAPARRDLFSHLRIGCFNMTPILHERAARVARHPLVSRREPSCGASLRVRGHDESIVSPLVHACWSTQRSLVSLGPAHKSPPSLRKAVHPSCTARFP
jgi:hypothetical protein